MTGDTTPADARRTSTCETPTRRAVLASVGTAVGGALGLSGVSTASETAPPEAGEAQAYPCDPDCTLDQFCCEQIGPKCIDWCWICVCE